MNKDIFFKLFNNYLVHSIIVKNIRYLHKFYFGAVKTYNYNQLIKEPHVLALYNYVDLFKAYEQGTSFVANVYNRILVSCIKGNSIDVLRYLLEGKQPDLLQQTFKYAYDKGDLLYFATKFGKVSIVQYLENLLDSLQQHNNNNNKNKKNNNKVFKFNYINSITIAPLSRNIDLLKYIVKKSNIICEKIDMNILSSTVFNAIKEGQIEMIDWLFEVTQSNLQSFMVKNIQAVITLAIEGGQTLLVMHYYSSIYQNCVCSANLIDKAAEYEQLEMIQFLHYHNLGRCTTTAMDRAARKNNLAIMRWLHENRTEGCTKSAMDLVAWNGNFEMMRWMHENRTEGCTTYAMDYAAQYGRLNLIKWLHENRTEGCTTNAMDYGVISFVYDTDRNLEIVKWLHENRTEGCTKTAMDNAAMYGQLEVLEWFHKNRTEGCSVNAMTIAISNNNLEVVEWLNQHYPSEGYFVTGIDEAIRNRYKKMLEYLVAKTNFQWSFNEYVFRDVVLNGYLDMVEFILTISKESEYISLLPEYIELAQKENHNHIVNYLNQISNSNTS